MLGRKYLPLCLAALVCLAACCQSKAAFAHHSAPAGRTDGIAISTLTHGQMVVIANHLADILDLADKQVFEDETFQKLRNYISLQYATCLWGMMPASVTDEESPFNECSHGYLSAVRALLLHMREMRGDTAAADRLIDLIEREMLVIGADMVLCRYSDEPFNSADVITPHWIDVPTHVPSALALIALIGLIGASSGIGATYLRRPR